MTEQLLGRDDVQATIRGLLRAAVGGTGGMLLLHGEPGIGKTELLGFARREARDMTVLSARPLASESKLPFAGLQMLVQPVLDGLDALSEPRRAALKGALGLGPPAAGSRFAVYVAALGLLGAASGTRPLLVLVDDAHWLDGESAEALAFVARRLSDDPVAILVAARTDALETSVLSQLAALEVRGLDRRSAVELLERGAGGAVEPAVGRRIAEQTAGNPLAIVEIGALLSDAQLAGVEPLPDPLPVGPRMAAALRRHVEQLSGPAREALVVAAASDSGRVEEIAPAIDRLGGSAAALTEAEDAGVIRLARGTLEFRHPLLRSAAYHGATPGAQRAAHAALADTLDAPRFAARRAWHRAAAAFGADESIAAELEQAGRDARARAAPLAAAAAFESAAGLSPDDRSGARRLLEAGRDLQLAGRSEQALRLLDDALERGDDALRSQIQLVRGQAQLLSRPTEETRALLRSEAEEVEARDAVTAAQMLVELSGVCATAGDVRAAVEAGRRASEVAARISGPLALVAGVVYGTALIAAGDARAGARLVRAGEPLLDIDELVTGTWLGGAIAQACVWVDDLARAAIVVERVVRRQRAAGALGFVTYTLAIVSDLEFRAGRWRAAHAAAIESAELAESLGQTNELAHALSRLAQLEAARGRERETRQAAGRALELAEAAGLESIRTYLHASLGHLDLAAGRTDDAIEHFEAVERLAAAQGLGEPNVVRWQADALEAYLHAGLRDRAEAALLRLEKAADRTGGSWNRSVAARGRALIADPRELDAWLGAAMGAHGGGQDGFERARTQLVLGERVRRSRRPADARPLLREALATFTDLSASVWAERARRELAAAGERSGRTHAQASRAELTAQELRVALEVARGATNREVAGALFVSPKTVEAHLGRVFRKLGVRSRSQLTRLLLEERPLAGQ